VGRSTRAGGLPPATPRRALTDDDIERLRLIKYMKPLEFSLEEMADLLRVRDRLAQGVEDETSRRELLDRLAMFAAAAEERCERLRDQLRFAEGFADTLVGRPPA